MVSFRSASTNLFQEPSEEQDVKWNRYFHQILVPHIIGSDEVVRNILRVVRALPSQHPELAADALSLHFTEMSLPDRRPLWAPEDAVDY